MIYILEGADGTGKTTLAKQLAPNILHSTYDKDWNMEQYHRDVIHAAKMIDQYDDVVIDRWAVSEAVYGEVFRDGPSYDTSKLIENEAQENNIIWIYCRHPHAVRNHNKNKKTRHEMFDDMTEIVVGYDAYVEYSRSNWIHIPWIIYDFSKINAKEFVKELKS